MPNSLNGRTSFCWLICTDEFALRTIQTLVKRPALRGTAVTTCSYIPNSPNCQGYVIEFKKHNPRREANVETTMQNALKQIQDKHYAIPLRNAHVSPIIGIGVVVQGKDVWVEWVDLTA